MKSTLRYIKFVLLLSVMLTTMTTSSVVAQWQYQGYGSDPIFVFSADSINLFAGGRGMYVARIVEEGFYPYYPPGSDIPPRPGYSISGLVAVDTVIIASSTLGVFRFYYNRKPALDRDTLRIVDTTLFAKVNMLARDSDRIFAAADDGVYYSDDIGGSWHRTTTPTEGTKVHVLAFPTDGGSMALAGTSDGIYRSSDLGITWWWSSQGIPEAATVDAIEYAMPWIFAGSTSGVFRSSDDGANWHHASFGIDEDARVYDFASYRGVVFAASDSGFYYTTDYGRTWIPENSSFVNRLDREFPPNVFALYIYGEYLYAGALSGGIWRRPLSEMLPPTLIETDSDQDQLIIRHNESMLDIDVPVDSPTGVSIELVDTYGRWIRRQHHAHVAIGTCRFHINTRGLPTGLYLIVIRTGETTHVQKVIVAQ